MGDTSKIGMKKSLTEAMDKEKLNLAGDIQLLSSFHRLQIHHRKIICSITNIINNELTLQDVSVRYLQGLRAYELSKSIS